MAHVPISAALTQGTAGSKPASHTLPSSHRKLAGEGTEARGGCKGRSQISSLLARVSSQHDWTPTPPPKGRPTTVLEVKEKSVKGQGVKGRINHRVPTTCFKSLRMTKVTRPSPSTHTEQPPIFPTTTGADRAAPACGPVASGPVRQGDPLCTYFEKQLQENMAKFLKLYTPPGQTGSTPVLQRKPLPPGIISPQCGQQAPSGQSR